LGEGTDCVDDSRRAFLHRVEGAWVCDCGLGCGLVRDDSRPDGGSAGEGSRCGRCAGGGGEVG
jgi:hypothetical protein